MPDWSWRINCHWLKLGDFFFFVLCSSPHYQSKQSTSICVHISPHVGYRGEMYIWFFFFFPQNMKIIIPLMLLFRPDHLSCHVKHVHSSERPFKCQVTVRPIPFPIWIILAFLICLFVCVCRGIPRCSEPFLPCGRRPVPLLLPPKTDSVHTWSDTKAKWPVASAGRCSAPPTSPAIWRLTDRPTLTPVTKVLCISLRCPNATPSEYPREIFIHKSLGSYFVYKLCSWKGPVCQN